MNPRHRILLCLLLFTLASFVTWLCASGSAAKSDSSRPAPDKNGHSSDGPILPQRAGAEAAREAEAARAAYGRLPLQFEENRGQMDERVRFEARGPGYNLFLTDTEALVSLRRSGRDAESGASVLRLSLAGANGQPRLEGREQLEGHANYFIGDDPAGWRTNVPTYRAVEYLNVYSGIDLVYHGNQQQLEYDFRLAAGADPDFIRLKIDGAKALRVDAEGDLLLEAEGGGLRQRRPFAYQEVNGERMAVACAYSLRNESQVGFVLGPYDRTLPLVIDPVLSYATYIGGAGNDQATGIAVDSTGAAYVTGYTESPNFPTTPGALQTVQRGPRHVFILKLNPAGNALAFSTYLGGSKSDTGYAIGVDSSGSAYVTGQVYSPDFPLTGSIGSITSTSFQTGNIFVTKLTPDGNHLSYSTVIGGSREETGYGLVVGPGGNAYVAGRTSSTNFPVTSGVVQPALRTGGTVATDGFVLQLNQAGSGLVFSTFLGGWNYEELTGVALDSLGGVYVSGQTTSPAYPVSYNALSSSLNGQSDAVLTELSPDARSIIYSTYIGGPGNEEANAVAVDAQGSFYAVGHTDSQQGFPTTPGAVQRSSAGALDGFVTRFDAGGSLKYSTLLGGAGDDSGKSIAVDSYGSAYLCGVTRSTDFPVTGGAAQTVAGGGYDAFISKLNADGSALVYSTLMGGNLDDSGAGIALDQSGGIYMTGFTSSANFPI